MNRWELLAEEYVSPFTDELLYEYDFGDSWEILITASDNSPARAFGKGWRDARR